MNRIVSFIPGRIRVRDPDLRNPRRMAALEGTLREVDGVETVECRPAAGSVVVQFGPVGGTGRIRAPHEQDRRRRPRGARQQARRRTHAGQQLQAGRPVQGPVAKGLIGQGPAISGLGRPARRRPTRTRRRSLGRTCRNSCRSPARIANRTAQPCGHATRILCATPPPRTPSRATPARSPRPGPAPSAPGGRPSARPRAGSRS